MCDVERKALGVPSFFIRSWMSIRRKWAETPRLLVLSTLPRVDHSYSQARVVGAPDVRTPGNAKARRRRRVGIRNPAWHIIRGCRCEPACRQRALNEQPRARVPSRRHQAVAIRLISLFDSIRFPRRRRRRRLRFTGALRAFAQGDATAKFVRHHIPAA